MARSAAQFGFWAALAAAAASIGYGVPQVLQVLGVLRDPWDRIFIFAPSLALAPCFVCATVASIARVSERNRVWAQASAAFAIMYAVFVSTVYVIQLGVIIPRDMTQNGSRLALWTCCAFRMPMTVVDLLGYTYMSASTLMLAGAYRGMPRAGALRAALFANAALGPVILGQLIWPWLIYPAAAWLVIFPIAMVLWAMAFRRGQSLDAVGSLPT